MWKNAISPAKLFSFHFSEGCRKRMLTKISLERLLAESSRLQDHRQRNCVVRSVTVESAVLSGHHVKTNVDVYTRLSLIPEYNTDPSDKTVQCDEYTC